MICERGCSVNGVAKRFCHVSVSVLITRRSCLLPLGQGFFKLFVLAAILRTSKISKLLSNKIVQKFGMFYKGAIFN